MARTTHARRTISIGAVVALLSALSLTAATASGASSSFGDAVGDSGAAPDLTTIDVSHNDAGDISFKIAVGNRGATLGLSEFVFVFLDTDANSRTGPGPLGTEYVLAFGALRYTRLGRVVSDSQIDFATAQATLFVSLSPGLNASINRSELGNTERFNFLVGAAGEAYEDSDSAPDDGVFSYSLAAPTIQSLKVSWSPAKPRAGKAFSVAGVQVGLSTGETAPASSYKCRAKLGSKALRSQGKCRWLLPATAKSKKLTVAVTAGYGSLAKTASHVFIVR